MTRTATLESTRRVLVLVDGQNLRGHLLELGIHGIDPRQLRHWAEAYGFPDVHWFQGQYPRLRGFFNVLRSAGVRLHLKEPKPVPGGLKADMDVEIAVTAMAERDRFDTLILVSADGDFEALVRRLTDEGKRVVVVAPLDRCAPELVQHVDPHDLVDLGALVREAGYQLHLGR